MIAAIATTTSRQVRVRRQEVLEEEHGFSRPRKFVFTQFGLEQIKMPSETKDEIDEMLCDEELSPEAQPIKLSRKKLKKIGFVSHVKPNESGLWPQAMNVSFLFDESAANFVMLELHRCRELGDWHADADTIMKVHKMDAEAYMILAIWLAEVCTTLKFHREAFHGAMSIIIRYLTARRVPLRPIQVQLVAVTALWIISRIEDDASKPAEVPGFVSVLLRERAIHLVAFRFLQLFDSNYSPNDLLKSETDMVNTLKADFGLRTSYHWLNLYIAYAKTDEKHQELVKQWTEFRNVIKCYQLLDAAAMNFDLCAIRPSVLGAVALIIVHPGHKAAIKEITFIVPQADLEKALELTSLICDPYLASWENRLNEKEGDEQFLHLPQTVDEQFFDTEMQTELMKQRAVLTATVTGKE